MKFAIQGMFRSEMEDRCPIIDYEIVSVKDKST
jgi:hypothetical protein